MTELSTSVHAPDGHTDTRSATPVVHFAYLADSRLMSMSPVLAPGGRAPSLDFRNALPETFALGENANQRLLGNIPDAAWPAAPPSGKGRTSADMAGHIHPVPLMWLCAADNSAKPLVKLQPDKAARAGVQAALKESETGAESDLQKALDDPAGKVPSIEPNVVAFIGYLIAHDPHHRRQIDVLTHQLGHLVDWKTSYGLWEWGWHRRDGGIGNTTRDAASK